MASPITYYVKRIEKYEEINIEFEVPLFIKGLNPNDLHSSRKYWIRNLSGIIPDNLVTVSEENIGEEDDGIIHGIMSPTDDVTLPPFSRETAGISKQATKFAFLHPPPSLASHLAEIGLGRCTTNDQEDFRLQLCMFSVFGAFVYFDERMEIVGMNVLTSIETDYTLTLAGPYEASKNAVKELQDLKRCGMIPLESYQESGFCKMAWVRSDEKFHSENATVEATCAYGAIMLFSDDGYALTYALVTSSDSDTDETKKNGSLANTLGLESSLPKGRDFFDIFKVSSIYMTHSDGHLVKQKVVSIMEGRKVASPDKFKMLLLEVIKARRPLKEVKALLNVLDDAYLLKADEYGWIPLHYACRFMSDNDSLIQILIEKSPQSVLVPDRYDRYPLHVACDNPQTTIEVIRLLLKGYAGGQIVLEQTKYLQTLPLHLACQRGLSKNIIAALLNADENGDTCREKMKGGKNALHISLAKKLEPDVIDMLLQADSRLNNPDVSLNSFYDDIYQTHLGLSPLHYACLSGSKVEIVRLLLEKDQRNVTAFQIVGSASASSLNGSIDKVESDDNDMSESAQHKIFFVGSPGSVGKMPPSDISQNAVNGMRALHLALIGNSAETVRFLLRREKYTEKSIHESTKLAKMVNVNGRNCLHLACKNMHMEPDIIKLLLDLDPTRISTTLTDNSKCTPLHLACFHKTANKETIQFLLDAESEYYKNSGGRTLKSTYSVNVRSRNPLNLAITADAPDDVIMLLMRPEYFSMVSMGPVTGNKLAQRVKDNAALQRSLNLIISYRASFMWLFFNVLIDLMAFCIFSRVFDPDSGDHQSRRWMYRFLALCSAILFIREIIQLVSQKSQYFFDKQNLYDLLTVTFLVASLIMFQDVSKEFTWSGPEKCVLIVCGILLALHTIVSLRSTFLPFAQFARGTKTIFFKLIPFFVTSIIVLETFIQLLRTRYQDKALLPDDDDTDKALLPDDDDTDTTGSACQRSLDDCRMKVYSGFFAGEEVNHPLDGIYGIVVVIILLNVVIAIVSDSWQDAKEQATLLYWQGRVSFLSESSITSFTSQYAFVEKITKWIDNVHVTISHDILWETDYPYNQVHSKTQYDDPYQYFTPDVAENIKATHCLTSDLLWIKEDSMSKSTWQSHIAVILALLTWSTRKIVYLFLLLLGIPTFGATWPRDFRIWLLSFGNSAEEEEEK